MGYVHVRTYAYVRGSITVHTSMYVPYVCSYVVLTWSRPTISSKILDLDPRSRVKSRLSRMWDDLVSSRSRRVILDLVSISPRGTRRDRDAPLVIFDLRFWRRLQKQRCDLCWRFHLELGWQRRSFISVGQRKLISTKIKRIRRNPGKFLLLTCQQNTTSSGYRAHSYTRN